MSIRKAPRPRGPSNFLSASLHFAPTKSVPPRAGSAGRVREPGSLPELMTASVIFHENVREMTMTIEQHIEELRAELKNAVDAKEREQIEREIEAARAELARHREDTELP